MAILRLLLLTFLMCISVTTLADNTIVSQSWDDQGPELILTPADSSGQFQDEPISSSAPEVVSMSPQDSSTTPKKIQKSPVHKIIYQAAKPRTYGPTTSEEHIWRLSQKLLPNSSVTVQQMMIALLHKNPTAFSENNINGLKVGTILIIPSLAQIRKIPAEKAQQLVHIQNQQWRKMQVLSEKGDTLPKSLIKKPQIKVLFPDPSHFIPVAQLSDSAAKSVTPTIVTPKIPTVTQIDMTVKTAPNNSEPDAPIDTNEVKLEQQLIATEQEAQIYKTEITTLEKENAGLQANLLQEEKIITALTKENQNKIAAMENTESNSAPTLPTQLSAYLPKSKVGWWIMWAMLFLIALIWMPSSKSEVKKRQEPVVNTDIIPEKINTENINTETIKFEDDYDFMNSQEALPAKLDLARAYIDMDDFSSAETLLKEVIEKGNTTERKQAMQLLKSLKIPA